jgi:hypothetical protein
MNPENEEQNIDIYQCFRPSNIDKPWRRLLENPKDWLESFQDVSNNEENNEVTQ